MDSEEFKRRAKEVSKLAIRASDTLPSTHSGRYFANQLLRSGCSVGANYRAACRARSRSEMIAKLGIVEEEADEVLFWIELMVEERLTSREQMEPLRRQTNEVLAMTVASIKTLKQPRKSEPDAQP